MTRNLTTGNKQFVGLAKIPAIQSIKLLKPYAQLLRWMAIPAQFGVFSLYQTVYIFYFFVCFDILLEAQSMSGDSDNPFLASFDKLFGLFNKISKYDANSLGLGENTPYAYKLSVKPVISIYVPTMLNILSRQRMSCHSVMLAKLELAWQSTGKQTIVHMA